MRRGFFGGIGAAIVAVLVVGAIALFAFHLGETRAITAAGGAPAFMGRGYGMHGGGFFFFPFLLFPLGLFLFFALMRMVFFGFGGHRHWMHDGMHGDNPMRSRLEEWHREAHRNDTGSTPTPPAPPAPPAGQ